MYRKFASIYDELMDGIDYKLWFDYIEEIFKSRKLKVEKVLEMAAGTGNLSSYLAKADYDLTCFDLSIDMLAILDKKLSNYKNVRVLNQDMVNFKTNEKYDAVLAICDSINYITEEEELKKVFKNVYDHLENKGIFIFDINSSYKLREIIGENIFVEDREDLFYTWENYLIEDRIVQFYINFFVKEGSDYTRFTEEHYERIYEAKDLVKLLEEVGFKEVDYYEAFTFDPVDAKTERINFVVRK